MKTNMYPVAAAAMAAAISLSLANVAQAGGAKYEICHAPPGNPENMQEISVSEKALPAHLAHGDVMAAGGSWSGDLHDSGSAYPMTVEVLGGCGTSSSVSTASASGDVFANVTYEGVCNATWTLTGSEGGDLFVVEEVDDVWACWNQCEYQLTIDSESGTMSVINIQATEGECSGVSGGVWTAELTQE